jgi:hypothetical protein
MKLLPIPNLSRGGRRWDTATDVDQERDGHENGTSIQTPSDPAKPGVVEDEALLGVESLALKVSTPATPMGEANGGVTACVATVESASRSCVLHTDGGMTAYPRELSSLGRT